MRSMSHLVGAIAGLLLLAGAPHGFAQSPTFKKPPYTLSPAGEGRRYFLALNCYGCHGMNGAGAMAINIQHAEKGDLSEAVLSGEDAGMPSFRQYVTSTDINNLSAYLATIGTPNEPTFTHWWEPYPTQ